MDVLVAGGLFFLSNMLSKLFITRLNLNVYWSPRCPNGSLIVLSAQSDTVVRDFGVWLVLGSFFGGLGVCIFVSLL